MIIRYYDWIWIIFLVIAGIIFSLYQGYGKNNFDENKFYPIRFIIWLIISAACIFFILLGVNWYRTSTATGIRHQKDYVSEINNGIEREITITAEDGREIYHYEGKVDIETDASKNYICFETPEGKRVIIYYGIQDTIKIIEK